MHRRRLCLFIQDVSHRNGGMIVLSSYHALPRFHPRCHKRKELVGTAWPVPLERLGVVLCLELGLETLSQGELVR